MKIKQSSQVSCNLRNCRKEAWKKNQMSCWSLIFFTVLFCAFAYWHIIFQFIFFAIVINFLIIIVIVVEIIIPLKVVCRLKVLIEILPCKCWPAGKIKHIYENLQRSQIRIYRLTHHATNRIAPGVRGLDWRVLPLNQIAGFVE